MGVLSTMAWLGVNRHIEIGRPWMVGEIGLGWVLLVGFGFLF